MAAVTISGYPDDSWYSWSTGVTWWTCPHGVMTGGYCYQCTGGTATHHPPAGWRCPGCGTCYAPTVPSCHTCGARCRCPAPTRHACGVCHRCWLPLPS